MKTTHNFSPLDKAVNATLFINAWAEVAIGGVLSVLLTVEVFNRYVLEASLLFSEELSRMLFIWFALLGATIALHECAHVGFDLIKVKLTGRWAKLVSILTTLVILIYSAFICYGCVTILPAQMNQMYAVLKIPRFWSYLSVAVGMSFLFIRALYTLICLIMGREENLLSFEEMFSFGRGVK